MDKLPEDENSTKEYIKFKPHHLSITVKDPERSKNFYKIFGFREIFRWSNGKTNIIHMKLNDLILEIFSFKDFIKPSLTNIDLYDDLKILGLKHIALKVDDIEKAKNFLIEKGIVDKNVEIKRGRTGILYFFIKDPDGIYIEIVQDCRNILKF